MKPYSQQFTFTFQNGRFDYSITKISGQLDVMDVRFSDTAEMNNEQSYRSLQIMLNQLWEEIYQRTITKNPLTKIHPIAVDDSIKSDYSGSAALLAFIQLAQYRYSVWKTLAAMSVSSKRVLSTLREPRRRASISMTMERMYVQSGSIIGIEKENDPVSYMFEVWDITNWPYITGCFVKAEGERSDVAIININRVRISCYELSDKYIVK